MNNNIEDFLTITNNGLDIDANNFNANCITSKNNTFSMDTNGNLICNSITTNTPSSSTILDIVYPVGSIYMSVSNTNPGSLFGGTWEQIKDKFLLSAGDAYTAGATGGNATHALLEAELPSFSVEASATNQGSSYTDGYLMTGGYNVTSTRYMMRTGTATPFSIMPPYLVVYVWKRNS